MHQIGGPSVLQLARSLFGIADLSKPATRRLISTLKKFNANIVQFDETTNLSYLVSDLKPDFFLIGAVPEDAVIDILHSGPPAGDVGIAIVGDSCHLSHVSRALIGGSPGVNYCLLDPSISSMDAVIQLRALVRRVRPLAVPCVGKVGESALEVGSMSFRFLDSKTSITVEDLRFLGAMFDAPDHIWTREELLSVAYCATSHNSQQTVDVKLNRTRRKLKSALGFDPIVAFRGRGYALNREALAVAQY